MIGFLALVICKPDIYQDLTPCPKVSPTTAVGQSLSGGHLSHMDYLWSGIPKYRLQRGGINIVHYRAIH